MTEEPLNPAVVKHTAVPPALVEAVAKDAAAAQPALRAMAIVQFTELHSMRHLFTPPQRMQLAESVAKLGGMAPKQEPSTSSGGAVTINFLRSGSEKSVTIEATAVAIPE